MRITLLTLACGLTLTACGGGDDTAAGDTAMTGADTSTLPMPAGDAGAVTAVMRDAQGQELGTLTLTDAAGGIAVSGRLTGMPAGEHGLHLHATGQCEAPTFESAGGHWNPTNAQHGTDNPQGPHFGDLPNVTVAADGWVDVQATTPGGSLRGENALLDADGAAVMVHAGPDDNRTDPSGASGDRIACGVVQGG